ncbi:serine hydrolase domain-containing protein [Telluribacter sp. SYSU D00476]|uniref:serine hydrolase domain-containing protein n=1 Tax=Telluribacter sp. SYSU D00476 TaxID=2811430 RepID=UPI001FF11581|nr:serine hydrolase domain-containing protein [Telluribacter sp. SYSU D00476]
MKIKLLAAALLLSLQTVLAQDTRMVQRLDSLLKAYEKAQQYMGTVLLAHNGEVLYNKAFGMANVANKVPAAPTDLHNVGSIGKMFTSVAIMQLVDRGELSLNEPIQTYLPEYNLPNADKITITHLLTHQSGLGLYMRAPGFDGSKDHSLDALVKLIATLPLDFETPGKGNAYSNSAFVVLGRIIEKQSGMYWLDYFQKHIFSPAGMTSTKRLLPGEASANKASGYFYTPMGEYQDVSATDPMPYPDGGLFSTPLDLFKFSEAIRTHKILSTRMEALMLKEYGQLDMLQCKMGLGWEISETAGRKVVGKGGNVWGFSAGLNMLPDGYTLVLASNQGPAASLITDNLINCLYGQKVEPIRMPTSNFIYQQIQAQGWESLKPRMEEVLTQNNYTLRQRDLVLLSRALADKAELKLATQILTYTTEKYPNYEVAWDVLGHVYTLQNDKANARKCYAMLLYLNPSNMGALKNINSLQATAN